MSVNLLGSLLGGSPERKMQMLLSDAGKAQEQGDWAVAAEKYAAALPLVQDRFGILVQLGHMQKEAGDFAAAEQSYTEALALQPDDVDLHVQFGHFFNRTGAPDAALSWYRKALALAPEDVSIAGFIDNLERLGRDADLDKRRRRALALMDSRQFEAAMPRVEALFHDDGLADFDVILGHAYRELGIYEKAETLYALYRDRCVATDNPQVYDACFQLGNVARLQGEDAVALNHYIDAKAYKNRTESFLDGNDPILIEINWCMARLYPVFVQK